MEISNWCHFITHPGVVWITLQQNQLALQIMCRLSSDANMCSFKNTLNKHHLYGIELRNTS